MKVEETRSQSELLTQAAKFMAIIRPSLPQIHTCQMCRHFKQQLSNITHVAPSVVDLIYKELALDDAAASHPETKQRLKFIFLGEKGLLRDLREVSPGRPGEARVSYYVHTCTYSQTCTSGHLCIRVTWLFWPLFVGPLNVSVTLFPFSIVAILVPEVPLVAIIQASLTVCPFTCKVIDMVHFLTRWNL